MARTFTLHTSSSSSVHLDLERDLNEAQRVAVTCGDGPKLVIAGAGSGKTRTITYRVAFLMTRGVHPSQILLATFTNKAAREMLSRVEALTGANAAKVWGGTFHAIGNRLLRHYGKVVGLSPNYTILDEEDSRDLLKVCITEAKVKVEEKRFPAPAIIQNLISFAFNTQRPLAAVIEERTPHFCDWTPQLQQVAQRYEAKKRAANAVDYDDLLRFWLTLLQEHPELAARLGGQFRSILVDEYQDTNIIQAQIVERLAEHNGRNLMVVGDDAQSIYAFRGANYDNILKFPERNPGTEVFKLEANYRSTPEILEFTNASIAHNQHQHRKTLTAQRTRGSLPVVLPVNDVYQEATFVAERILQLRDEGIALADMAVLYRAHSHSSMLQAELIKRNIPYDVRSGVRFFEQAHIKDVVAYLKILDNASDEIAWRRLWLMLPRIGNATAARLWEAIAPAKDPLEEAMSRSLCATLPPAAQPHFKRFQKDLRALRAVREDRDPMGLVHAVLETAYPEYLRAKYEAFASRLDDIRQLGVFAQSYRTLRSLLSELVLLGELYGQEVAAGGSRETERLILSSVHQAKGLEWRVVFIIRMCDGDFPSDMALRETGGEEEERRIFYVASTRAKDELYLTHPLIDMGLRGEGQVLLQPSRFLREIRFTLYEQAAIEETPWRSVGSLSD
ncbi:MAG: ATP-dependent helicase [Candidatus Omnitrophota bacterium]|nr:ATP-dependent helicase [Candidatus Omnitrophota bacterium]